MSNCYCCKKETKPTNFSCYLIFYILKYFSSILIWKWTVSNFVSWKEKRKPKQKPKQQHRKTGRIHSTGSLHKCQLSPLINYLVSVVSSSLHLLLLELFSYGKVCWYSTHRVKGTKKRKKHDIISQWIKHSPTVKKYQKDAERILVQFTPVSCFCLTLMECCKNSMRI